MSKINRNLIDEAKHYVSNILDAELPEICVFHTKQHTFDVLKNVELIGEFGNLNDDDLNILRVSALFHDIGYVKLYAGHEQESASMAANFLDSNRIEKSSIKLITSAILATKVPQQPKTQYSKILCDADLMHLTYASYFENMELMRLEWELTGIATFTEKEFHNNSVQFFNSHFYRSGYGKLYLESKKRKNLELIIKRIAEL